MIHNKISRHKWSNGRSATRRGKIRLNYFYSNPHRAFCQLHSIVILIVQILCIFCCIISCRNSATGYEAQISHRSSSSNSQVGGGLLVCPENWFQHSGQCYRFFPQRRSWSRARESCERHGAQLALVLDYQQNNFTSHLASMQLHAKYPNSNNNLNFLNSVTSDPVQSTSIRSSINKLMQSNGAKQQVVYTSDERSYWLGFRTLDKLETNTLESAANTFVSKYLGFWDFNEPQVSQGDCVRATVRLDSLALSSSISYKSAPSQLVGKFN